MTHDIPVPASDVFVAMLQRDLRVARREIGFTLVRTLMQPTLLMIVFGYLLPKMQMLPPSYITTLLPGVLAVSLALSAVQSVALPMVASFGATREIEDRLLAPLPTHLVALELVVVGVIQGEHTAAYSAFAQDGLRVVPWLQKAVLVNPLVYASEGMRGVLTPGVPHMDPAIVAAVLTAVTVFAWWRGLKAFYRRAVG